MYRDAAFRTAAFACEKYIFASIFCLSLRVHSVTTVCTFDEVFIALSH